MYENPQMYRWRDPSWPREMPSLQVYFLNEPQVNQEATAQTGVQTYDNVLTAYVGPAGLSKSNAAHEVRRTLPDGAIQNHPRNSLKYGEQLKLYDAGTLSETVGTPLKDLIGMTPATIMNLKARGIHTVEMLADLSDAAGQELMGFWEYRDRARKHIEMREKNAPMLRVEAMEDKHAKEIASLTRQIEELQALAQQPEKRGPGRPPKVQEAA